MIEKLIYSLFILSLIAGCSKNTENLDSSATTASGARGIYRGTVITERENPAVGIVLIWDREINNYLTCTGSLIASNVVLTAAHCITRFVKGDPIFFSFDSKLSPKSKVIRVIDGTQNSDYRPTSWGIEGLYDSSADLALLKLESKIQVINPLKIAEAIPAIPSTGLVSRIIGYGSNDTQTVEEIDHDMPGFGILSEFEISQIDIGGGIKRRGDITFTRIANGVGKGDTNQPFVVAPNEFLVTPSLVGTYSQRSCHGDSGGPAMIKVNGKYQIVGIVAGGLGDFCALSSRGFYTNMVKYKTWAEKGIELLNPIKGACTFEDANFQTEDGGCKQVRQQLVWSFVPRNLMTRTQAKSYCDNLVEGNRDDWRLPTVSELQQLAALGTSHLDISRAKIPGTLWTDKFIYSVSSLTGRAYPAIYYPYQIVACVRK